MALTLADRELRRLTAGEVMRMVESGILGQDERVELLHGVLTAVTPQGTAHATVVARLMRWFIGADPAGRYEVRPAAPLVVPDKTSLPEPDVAVVDAARDVTSHPVTALLAIEVAAGSLRTDTEIKPALYAAAGVPEYWVVDLARRRLLAFSAPSGDGYDRRETHEPPTALGPRAVDAEPLDLALLFDGV